LLSDNYHNKQIDVMSNDGDNELRSGLTEALALHFETPHGDNITSKGTLNGATSVLHLNLLVLIDE